LDPSSFEFPPRLLNVSDESFAPAFDESMLEHLEQSSLLVEGQVIRSFQDFVETHDPPLTLQV
jgi:hypothetical protein